MHNPNERDSASSLTSTTPVNVRETEQGYEVTAHLPGVKPEDIELTVRDNTLSLRAHYQQEQKREDKEGNWHVREIRSGSFARTLALPKTIDADRIATHYENGELKIELPISEASRARRINVTTTDSQQQVQSSESQQPAETH